MIYADSHIQSIRKRLEDGWNIRLSFLKEWCPEGARSLDLGARYGEYTLPLATLASHVDALDTDCHSLAVLSEFASELGIANVEPSSENFVSWAQQRAHSFDFCMCTGTWFYLTPKLRNVYLDTFRHLLVPDGRLLIDFYEPRYFLYRALIQKLPLSLKTRSLLAFFYRRLCRTYVTQRIFVREAKVHGFSVTHSESKVYYACREIEGHNFNTIFGTYWSAYLLTIN
jgi:2-polyprenyl-3-methyl-5-hydroxy-6-metoxy-1,4-benzoquinol methylase